MYLEKDGATPADIAGMETWTTINLPHTWNSTDPTDMEPGYRRGVSWYKKTLSFTEIHPDTTYQLYFEGVNITADVYVNNQKVGSHVGGYLGFSVNITSYIHPGENQVYVRVDNGYNPAVIPSQKSDFVIYGGITRDVWLETLPMKHLEDIKISTPSVTSKNATLKANIAVSQASPHDVIRVVLKDPDGHELRKKEVKGGGALTVTLKNIVNPKLWDIDAPHLYTFEVALLKDNKVVDSKRERFGFRWFEFKDYGAFYLNGKRVLLRGTHRHEEQAGVGAAMTNEQHYADIKAIKEMGANFVRLAHYPQDPEIYKACDELGLLVWDELPWCRGGLGDDLWKANTKNQLKEMIHQNYNHPSIIIWSLGNEVDWLPDYPQISSDEGINQFLKELNTLAHEMDPGRKTAIRKYEGGAAIVDVFSPSIWSGWYSGSYKNYQMAIDTYKKKYPHFVHAEYGGSSHIGRHSESPITGEGLITSDGWEEEIVQGLSENIASIGDWSENYMVNLFDWHLRVSELDSTFVGNIQWAYKDFATPLRPENDIPYMNQKGITDRNGNPKDAYYVFKSYWAKEPFVYIESHTWTERQGPQGKPRNVKVYSNCREVSLFLNGKELGFKKRDILKFPASGLNWDLEFKEGSNTLIAKGKTLDGKEVNDTLKVEYRYQKNGPPRALTLSHKKLDNGNILVTAFAIDKDGLRCLDYEEKVYFQCLKGGNALQDQGTPTGSQVINMANGKASIEVIPDGTSSKIVVAVLNQTFKGSYLFIDPNAVSKP